MTDRIRLFNQSCPPLRKLLDELQHLPATRVALPADGIVDPPYAAVVWKRLFLIALERMGRRQESLARVTAVEALNMLLSVSTHSKFPAAGKLAAMQRRVYSTGQLKPRAGLHPDNLLLRYYQSLPMLTTPIREEDLVALWRAWGGGQIPVDLKNDLTRMRTAHRRAIRLLATAFGYTIESVETLLKRARKRTPYAFAAYRRVTQTKH